MTDSEHYAQLPKILPRWEESITFYNCDIPLPQVYLYEKGLFPTGRCIVEVEGDRAFEIHPDPSESVWIGDGGLPDFRVMKLHVDGNPAPLSGQSLILECEGYRVEMESIDPLPISKPQKETSPPLLGQPFGGAELFINAAALPGRAAFSRGQ